MDSRTTNYAAAHTLDVTTLMGRLVFLKPGSRRGMRVDLDGHDEVELQLAESMPSAGAAAGIPQDVYDHYVMCNETVSLIDQGLAVGRTLLQVLEDSRAHYVDGRNNDISLMVDAMRSRAQRRRDETILTPFEDVIRYAGQIGEKAARTRRRNAEAAEEAAEQEAEGHEAHEAHETPAALVEQLEAFTAELWAQFDAAVQAAVQQRLAGAGKVAAAAPSASASA
jgi:hypothetical protein